MYDQYTNTNLIAPANGVFRVYHSKRTDKNCCCPCALTKHHAMKAYWGSGCIAPLIL
jgi:hypothetical protein